MTAPEAAKSLPSTVFFRGQSAPIQARNSSGVQFTKDSLLLVTLVDTAGYSSSVQQKYQAYLITESPMEIEGHRLEPGAYGCVSSLAIPSSSWTSAATTSSPSALPGTPTSADRRLCRSYPHPMALDTDSTWAASTFTSRRLRRRHTNDSSSSIITITLRCNSSRYNRCFCMAS